MTFASFPFFVQHSEILQFILDHLFWATNLAWHLEWPVWDSNFEDDNFFILTFSVWLDHRQFHFCFFDISLSLINQETLCHNLILSESKAQPSLHNLDGNLVDVYSSCSHDPVSKRNNGTKGRWESS